MLWFKRILTAMLLGIFLCSMAIAASLTSAVPLTLNLPSPRQRVQMIEAVSSEMIRLDAEGFLARTQRNLTWSQIVEQIKLEAGSAQNWDAFHRAISRLDAAYTNLHARAELGSEYLSQLQQQPIKLLVRFDDEWLAPTVVRHVVGSIDPSLRFSEDVQPKIGDELMAINGRPIQDWENENFNFCKWPLKSQCDVLLAINFEKELLSWERSSPLNYTLKRGEKVWDLAVPIKDRERKVRDFKKLYCRTEAERYPGYELSYIGNRACIYQKSHDPHTAILRITSFHYLGLLDNEPITSVEEEIDHLYSWWQKQARWQHLIIDVIDNGGGNAPIPYYEILLQKQFQEQFTAFKKLPELLDTKLRSDMFWGSGGQEIWFQNLLSSGQWDQVSNLDLLPPVPMFCADDSRNCLDGLFVPRQHPFQGRVSILLNEGCVSACDGFVFALKEQLGSKVSLFGHPQAADSAYARLTINIDLEPSLPLGFSTRVSSIQTISRNNTLFRQTVTVALSLMGNGEVVTGRPLALNGFVPQTIKNWNQWPAAVLNKALTSNP
jgi:hypothetical protein